MDYNTPNSNPENPNCLNQDGQDYRINRIGVGTIDTFSKHKRLLSQNNIGIPFSYPANPENHGSDKKYYSDAFSKASF